MTWLNRGGEDSTIRATTLSIVNQADAVGQWTGGPAIGPLGTVTSIRVALAAATACLLPALGFLRAATRRRRAGSRRVAGTLPRAGVVVSRMLFEATGPRARVFRARGFCRFKGGEP